MNDHQHGQITDIAEKLKCILDDIINCQSNVPEEEINANAQSYVDASEIKDEIFDRIHRWTLCDRKRFEARYAYLQHRAQLEKEVG